MKKLLLLIGLVVFFSTSVKCYESSLPKCNIKNNNNLTSSACFGKIEIYSEGIYSGEFNNFKKNGFGILKGRQSYTGYWKNDRYHGEGLLIVRGGKFVGSFAGGFFKEGEFTDNTGWKIKGTWKYGYLFKGKIFFEDKVAFSDNISSSLGGFVRFFDNKDSRWKFITLDISNTDLIYNTKAAILKIGKYLNFAPSSSETLEEILERLGNAKCIDDKCFCSGGSIYTVDRTFTKDVHDVCDSKRYKNKQITLKEYLELGGEIKLDESSVATDNLQFVYCKRLDLDGGNLSYISAFNYTQCPEDSSSAKYVQVTLEEYNKSNQEHLESDLKWQDTLKRYNQRGYQNQKTSSFNASFDDLAKAVGCGIKRKDIKECLRRWLPVVVGSGPMTLENVEEVARDRQMMGEIVKAIEEMHRANNKSVNQEPTEEEKALAQAQRMQNNQGFIYNHILEKHLNARGWTQVNPKLEKILNSMGRSQVPIKYQKRFTTASGWKF